MPSKQSIVGSAMCMGLVLKLVDLVVGFGNKLMSSHTQSWQLFV